ncbi:hypothetical protein F3Y22_tig00110163pilonHSYRG00108 [Hibiscus syriacus]|uniref:RNase H type-1 domain-containing protein n=1 Tax=Hibiscus syriacus TaxID=106335 RepID=A0A6A3BH85_HIBSY|nr:hypothetical protein F3Y22_tig00110163pilonHSYRG00108 [Hibiscus syriacus]
MDRSRWMKPPHGAIKINVEGALSVAESSAVIGVVARDHYGLVVAGHARSLQVMQKSGLVEIKAFSEELKLAPHKSLTNVILEGDAAFVVNKLARPREDLSLVSLYLREAHGILVAIIHIRIQFTRQDVNVAAHILAQWALHCTILF